jgi:hypothetical protein
MSQLVTSDQMTTTVDSVVTLVRDNIPGLLILVGFIIGLSIVGALVDTWREESFISERLSRRKHL